MIKTRLGGVDVTIKKVTLVLNENIEDILLEYVGKRNVSKIVAKLKQLATDYESVIAEFEGKVWELGIGSVDIPLMFEKGLKRRETIYKRLMENGFTESDARECLPLICSFEEVSDDEASDYVAETSKDDEAETSEA